MLDAIVVGAGLSGLQAALSLQQAGLKVEVIEARDRVGGKVWSVPLASGRGCADLGAAWINDIKQPRIASYVKRFKLRTEPQRLSGTAVMQFDNDRIEFPFGIMPDFTPEEKRNLEYVRDHIQAESLKPEKPRHEDDQIDLDRYVRDLGGGEKTLKMVNLWVKAMHGLESTEESAAYFIDYCRRNGGLLTVRADDRTGGNYLRVHGGTQQIAEAIADLIGGQKIHLESPVKSIQDLHSHVIVSTISGTTCKARKCIVSIPSAMYRDLDISPPLPSRVREVTAAGRLGDYNKAIVCYDQPWWRKKGYNGFFMSYTGPIALARDTSVEELRHYSLTCFVNGDFGRKWSKLHPHERRAAVLRQLAEVFSVSADSEVYRPIEMFEQIWMQEEYSKGALVPVTALGHLTEYADVYGKPIGNLHFVGTEYATEWRGYMEGALCSGESGAKEVANVLKPRRDKANF